MAEVLGLGVTHYPPLMGQDDKMSWVLDWTLQDPDMPAELRDPAAWPEPMRAEYGTDRGRSSAARHRARCLDGLRAVRAALDEFGPDVVLIWGDDQYENFREDLVPPFALLGYGDVTATPWASVPYQNVWNEPAETEFKVRGAPEAGRWFAEALLADDIDMAYAYQPLHHPSLPHSFLNALLLLDYDRTGLSYPVLPMAINCYGRRVISFHGGRSRFADRSKPFDPPSPSPRRCMDVGAAVARAALASPWRVALLASSSWSHAFLTDHTYRLYPLTSSPTGGSTKSAGSRRHFATWRGTSTLADVERRRPAGGAQLVLPGRRDGGVECHAVMVEPGRDPCLQLEQGVRGLSHGDAVKVGRVLRTGLDADGRSTAVEDRVVDPRQLPTGRLLTELWAQESFGGLRYWLLTVPADVPAAPARMHAMPTLDLGIVLAGHLRLILEDGSSNDLLPGDAFVQTGTGHAYAGNPGPDPAVLAVVCTGQRA